MKLTKISRSKSFEMVNGFGLKSWEKFQLEGDLAEQENPLEAYVELGKIIDEAFKEAHPKVVEPPKEIQVKETEQKLTKEEKQKDEISSCTDITVLESYRLIVKKYPYLQEVYDETMIKLTKKD